MQKLIAKEFGLKEFYLNIEAQKEINASTYPISYGIDCMPVCRLNKNFIIDRKGMRFKEEAGLIIVTNIYSGLLLNPNYSAGEIIACLLHEIGHNFQCVIDDTMFWLTDATYITTIIRIIIQNILNGRIDGAISAVLTPITASNLAKNIGVKLDQALLGVDFIRFLVTIQNNIVGRVKSGMSMLTRIIGSILGYSVLINPAMLIAQLINGIIGTIFNPIGYRGEQIADNFATIYGYGTESNTLQMRMETEHDFGDSYEKYLNKSFIGSLLRTGYGILALTVGCLDEHPNSVERCLSQIRYLKTELESNKGMSPELKREIKNQIDTMENNLAEIMDNPNLYERWDAVRYRYASIIYGDGGDFRHNTFMGKDINKNIQKRYDSKIKLI